MSQRAGCVPPDIDQQRHAGMWLLGQGCCVKARPSTWQSWHQRALPSRRRLSRFVFLLNTPSMFVHFQRIILVERVVCGSPPFSFCFPSQTRSSSAGSLACVWQALLERDYQRCCEHQADAATQYRHLFERRQEALVMKRSSVEVRGLGGWAADSPVVDFVANRGNLGNFKGLSGV